MSRKQTLLTIILSLLAAALLLLAGVLLFRESRQPASPDTNFVQDTTPAQSVYWIREYQGKLAVYRGNAAAPYQIHDVYVSTLPEYDQELLREGVPAYSQAQLDRLLEDYTS